MLGYYHNSNRDTTVSFTNTRTKLYSSSVLHPGTLSRFIKHLNKLIAILQVRSLSMTIGNLQSSVMTEARGKKGHGTHHRTVPFAEIIGH